MRFLNHLPNIQSLAMISLTKFSSMNRPFSNSSAWLTRSMAAAMMLTATHGFAADWPGWLGPARDGHASPGSVVPKSPPLDPKRVWELPIGEGHSSPVVAGDKADYAQPRDIPKQASPLRGAGKMALSA